MNGRGAVGVGGDGGGGRGVVSFTEGVMDVRAQELCESRGGRPGLPSLISLRFLWTAQSNV